MQRRGVGTHTRQGQLNIYLTCSAQKTFICESGTGETWDREENVLILPRACRRTETDQLTRVGLSCVRPGTASTQHRTRPGQGLSHDH